MNKKLLALQKAIAASNMGAARASLDRDLLEAAAPRDQVRLLAAAIVSRAPRIVQQILESGVPATLELEGAPLLVIAIRGFPEDDNGKAIVQLLLEHGADPEAPDSHGWLPVKLSAWEGKAGYVELLLKAGANPAASTGDGRPDALELAVFRGHLDVARTLIRRSPLPLSPVLLHVAARTGDPRMVAELLKAKIDVNGADETGSTALMAAVSGTPHDDPAAPSAILAVLETLLLSGADANARNHEGRHALDLARQSGDEAIIALLSEWTDHPALAKNPSDKA